jgi:hypothetical protein
MDHNVKQVDHRYRDAILKRLLAQYLKSVTSLRTGDEPMTLAQYLVLYRCVIAEGYGE